MVQVHGEEGALASTFKDQAPGFICLLFSLPEQTVLFLEPAQGSKCLVFVDKSQSGLHQNDSQGLKNGWLQFKIMQWFGHRRQNYVIRFNQMLVILKGLYTVPTGILNNMLKASYFKSIEP